MANDRKNEGTSNEVMVPMSQVKQMIEDVLKTTLPMATVAAAQVLGGQRSSAVMQPPKTANLGERCDVCLQFKTACEEKHAKLVVAPSNPRRFKSFPGCIINGVLYKSPRTGVPVVVPAKNDMAYMIRQWEEGEEDLLTGRKLDHDSGSLGPNYNRTRAAEPFGFRGAVGQ